MRYSTHHLIFRIIRNRRPVTDLAVKQVLCAILIDGHRLYVQAVPCEVETPVSYLIALSYMYIVVCLCLLLLLLVTVVRLI